MSGREMEQKQSMQQFKGQSRLPKFAVPKRYDLTLRPDFLTCSFSGTVLIDLSIADATKFLVLNALELTIDKVWFTKSEKHEHLPIDVVLDHDDEILVLVFDKALDVGNGVLGIEFSGILNEHMKGLYRSTYMDGGVKKNMVVTQFEAVDARLCFPCWDEPALKAIFKITVDVPSELTALSNMPVVNEKHNGAVKTVTFEESPLMSTYLVALVVGAFDHIEGTTADGIKVGVYCPVGKSDQGKFALDVAMKALDIFTKYFSVAYPLPKLDMVGVSDFGGGAMENYGLIVYRESELLYDELHSSAANKQRLVIVVAHEVAHQWFGNLVTMEWWTHLWLNEGFATWISYLVADMLYPEWKIWTQFLKEFTGGLHIDALEQSHPIEVEVHHARSVIEVFDAISYEKGSAIIRMLQDFIGDQLFRKSLATYMQRYGCKSAKTDDLWRVLTEESGVQVDIMMDTWTKQKGYPVISVRLDGNTLEFDQAQFQLADSQSDRQWIVPMIISVGSYDRRKNFLLETRRGILDISELFISAHGDSDLLKKENRDKSDDNLWIKINVDQTGFFRVKYEDKLAAQLMRAIQNNQLSAADRFGILDDTFSFFEACELQLSSLLTLMDVYRKETDFVVLSGLIEICTALEEVASISLPSIVNELKQYFVNLLLFSAEKLGWESIHGECHLDAMLREKTLMALATFGHDDTLLEATKRFQAFLGDRNTPLLPAATRRAAYVAVMRNASATARSGFESLLNVYREADAVHEKTRVLRCLTSSADPALVLEVLNLTFTDEIREQDIIYLLRWVSSEGHETAWIWFKENWDLVLKKWGSGLLLSDMVKAIIVPFHSGEKADEIEEFFKSHPNSSIVMNVKQSIEQVRMKARWVQKIMNDQSLDELVKGLASRR